jgi:hypothetical protein
MAGAGTSHYASYVYAGAMAHATELCPSFSSVFRHIRMSRSSQPVVQGCAVLGCHGGFFVLTLLGLTDCMWTGPAFASLCRSQLLG